MAMNARVVWGGAVLVSLGVVVGCGGGGSASGGPAAKAVVVTAAVREEAKQIFGMRCVACHGAQGRGDGPGAASLTPPPRDYHDKAWQASVTDQQIEQVIVSGGAAVGKSPLMVANPDLGNRPELVMALREIIRDFGKQ